MVGGITRAWRLSRVLEAWMGFEPTYDGFANRCLTTWPPRRTTDSTSCCVSTEPSSGGDLAGPREGVIRAPDRARGQAKNLGRSGWVSLSPSLSSFAVRCE